MKNLCMSIMLILAAALTVMPCVIGSAQEIKQDAEAAKSEARKAEIEAEKAKAEAKIQQKAAELQKQKLQAEMKETEVAKKEAEMAKKIAASGAEVKEAVAKKKKEEAEDKIAKEKTKITEEKMQAAQKKAMLAEEELALAKEKLDAAMKRLKEEDAGRPALERMTEAAVIILIGIVLLFLMRFAIKRFEKNLTKHDVMRESETTLRIRTAVKLFDWMGGILIVILVVYLILERNGISVAPLIAGAGIIGLAFGFGGQYLIRDLINGLFILIEGQYRIDDVVKIGDYSGLVEDINLRITTLRDLEGKVIIIPNGEIKAVVNFTKDYSQALLDIGIAYKENVDKVMDVIREIGAKMRKDERFGKLILEDLEMLGVDDFQDSAVIIKFRMKTLPIKQWEVAREFRRRLKNRFDELGIEIPFPHRTIYWGSGAKPELK